MQYLTAYGALIAHAQITKTDFVVITAASSSVGIAAIEMVKAEGAVSIATTRTSKKKATLVEVGATHVIATQEEDFIARVKEITGGKGARVIFDPIAGKGVERRRAVEYTRLDQRRTITAGDRGHVKVTVLRMILHPPEATAPV